MIPQRGNKKAALVTGASRGIGRAIAERLAAEGYRVFAVDLNAREAELADLVATAEANGGRCEISYCDVSDPSSVDAMARDVLERAGRLDVLVNNAGVRSVHTAENIEPDEWDRMFAVNTKGTFLVTKAFLAQFISNGNGRVINIASIGGKLGGPTETHYCASKGAVVNFTQGLAREVAKSGVTVNAVCPGVIATDMGRTHLEDPETLRKVLEKTAMGRVGNPDDIVGAVAFFASDDASFITGQSLNVDGGIIFH
ncbi:SDR family NAD(P)-dependent oxidoreductase [Rhizobium sp. S152]|uniref:SDR family NAD(P)-dependent oxidoreductase n=1 Tax=Rhizobium sp. S152 TaxID=3055038 RepID=UPI0025A9872F|nr:SDR family NAD(P)-dependent oxidoreductase [Rhizobium sp. S152]MDM9625026.1 SDR family NAD(P)-dependent oxidoreductase [Rhizobium sp. S152]